MEAYMLKKSPRTTELESSTVLHVSYISVKIGRKGKVGIWTWKIRIQSSCSWAPWDPPLHTVDCMSCEVRHWLSCLQLLIYTPTTVSGIEWIVNRHYWLNEWTVKSSFAAMWVAERNRGDMSLEARQTQGLHRELFLLGLCLNFLTYKMGIIYRLSRIHVKFKWQCILISQLMYLCI